MQDTDLRLAHRFVSPLLSHPLGVEPNRAQLVEITRLIDGGALRPIVGAVFPLADARQAYQHKAVRGKVVLRVGDAG
jgi:NADPH:quinone reductase-like Zn-dependent oxidoreductase